GERKAMDFLAGGSFPETKDVVSPHRGQLLTLGGERQHPNLPLMSQPGRAQPREGAVGERIALVVRARLFLGDLTLFWLARQGGDRQRQGEHSKQTDDSGQAWGRWIHG